MISYLKKKKKHLTMNLDDDENADERYSESTAVNRWLFNKDTIDLVLINL